MYAPPEFQTTEIILPKDRTGKVITQLLGPGGRKLLSRAGTKGSASIPTILAALGVGALGVGALGMGALGGGSAKAAEITQPEVKKPEIGTPIKYDSNIGAIVNENTDQPASQNQILSYIKDNPLKVTAGTSLVFSAQEVPGAYKAARELGRGKVRSAVGITGALKPILTTLGTPAMTGLLEVPLAAKRLEEGETATEILTDPLGPALGVAFMEPFSRGAGVIQRSTKKNYGRGFT